MISKTKTIFWAAYAAHLILIRISGLGWFDLHGAWGLIGFLLVSLTYATLAAGFSIASRAFDGVIAIRAMQANLNSHGASELDAWISTGSVQKHMTDGLREIIFGSVLVATGAWLIFVVIILGNGYGWP